MYISDRQSTVFPGQKIFRYTPLARGADRIFNPGRALIQLIRNKLSSQLSLYLLFQ